MESLAQSVSEPQAVIAAAGGPEAARTLRLAYLLSQYPALSHTFFLKEVLGLRARGLHIETASINAPDRDVDDLPSQEAAEARQTEYIKSTSKLAASVHIVGVALSQPAVVVRGIAGVFRMKGLNLRERGLYFFYLAEALLVGRWMRTRNLTHLHIHFGGPVASVGMLASIAWRLPYSLTIHGPEELLNVDACHLREKLRRASFVFCISDFCRSQLYQLMPADTWSKFKVIRLGVDPLVLTPSPEPHNAAATLQVVCTGRLVAAKGHHILLEALKLLRDRGYLLHATLIGKGPERKNLEFYVKRHKMENSVMFTAGLSHDATLKIVRSADIFALASFAEGIPVALMEAMSFGVPCVSTTIAGIPELIRSGQDGLLVPPANVTALADALQSLASNADLRRHLGSAGRERVISNYNLPLNQERLAQCFKHYAAKQGATKQSNGKGAPIT